MAVFLRVLVRSVVLLAIGWAAAWLGDLGVEGGGANIGAGLMAFLAMGLTALVWGFLDARRDDTVGRTVLTWVLVAVVVGVAAAVQAQAYSSRLDWDVLGTDLLLVSPFVAGIVLVPALASVAAAVIVRRAAPGAGDGSAP